MVGKILDLIEQIYCKKYIGKLKVEKLPIGYSVGFWLDRNTPTIIAAEIEDENDFLQYLAKELRNSYWHHNKYTKCYEQPYR